MVKSRKQRPGMCTGRKSIGDGDEIKPQKRRHLRVEDCQRRRPQGGSKGKEMISIELLAHTGSVLS